MPDCEGVAIPSSALRPTFKLALAPPILTVVFRNDGPLIFCNDSPSYRTVRVRLTGEQRRQLARRWIGVDRGQEHFESISQSIIEEEQ